MDYQCMCRSRLRETKEGASTTRIEKSTGILLAKEKTKEKL